MLGAQQKRYAQRHPDRVKANRDKYHAKHRERLVAGYKKRREELKAAGICTDCGRRKATRNRVLCGQCRKKARGTRAAFLRRDPAYKSKEHRKMRYGISWSEFHALRDAHGGKCAICGRSEAECKKGLHVDHNHQTGGVRGLLCFQCNISIAAMDRDMEWGEKALRYLTQYANRTNH